MTAFRWTDDMHEAWKARRAKQCAEIDELDRDLTRNEATINAAAEGTRIRKDRGGVVPVPHSSAAAPILERDVLAGALQAVAIHPSVAWAQRMNTGGVERENNDGSSRYIKFAFKGCSDIIGQMKDGRFLAIEIKRPGGRATTDQIAFLDNVKRNRGVAFIAWSVDDVIRGLASA